MTGDRIGDALVKWPAIAGLKHAAPALNLIWVAGRRASVFNGALKSLAVGVIDEVHDQANLGVSWRELRHRVRFGPVDTVIATEPKIRDALLAKRIEHRRFISPALRFRLSDRKLDPGESYPRSVTAQMKRLFELAVERPIELDTAIPLDDTLRETAAAMLPSGPVYVGLSPGAGGVRKRWPLPKFIAVADDMVSRGFVPVFFLGPDELDMAEEIRAAVPTALLPEVTDDSRRRGTPLLTIALAARLRVAVANDAGGGHLLAAGGQPLISLYGHTVPEKFKPPYGRHVAVTARVFGGREMDRIPVVAVLEQIDRICPRQT